MFTEWVDFAYSTVDGAPFGFSTAAIYADLTESFSEQMAFRFALKKAAGL